MSSSTITFKRDGTYSNETVSSFASTGSRTTAVSGGSGHGENGKYRIDGAAFHLLPDGGKERVFTAFAYDDGSQGPAPRSGYFGGGMIKRLK
jgi:hypothetical protein